MSAPSHIRPATRGDLPEVVDLVVACDIAEIGQPDTTAEDVERDWDLDGFTLNRDAWVAEAGDGTFTGYAYAGDQLRTGEFEADLWVLPGRDEPELAPRLLALAERRALELVRERGFEDPSLNVCCSTGDRAKREMLLRHDFTPERTIYRMSVDLDDGFTEFAAPEGIDIRPFRLDGDEHTMNDTMTAVLADYFRRSKEPFDAWKTRLLEYPDFDPDLWFLAWDGDQAAGALIAFDHGDLGCIQGLGVRHEWRRRGLGGALLTHAFAEFARHDQARVDLVVDAEGATRPLRLYENAGMRIVSAYELHAKQLTSGT